MHLIKGGAHANADAAVGPRYSTGLFEQILNKFLNKILFVMKTT